jgi:protein associated with RNAse G/E
LSASKSKIKEDGEGIGRMSPAQLFMSHITVSIMSLTGQAKQRWEAVSVLDSEDLIVLHGAWERLLTMKVGDIPIKNQSLECYWPNQPYTVSAIYDQEWDLREYYVRVLRDFKRDKNAIQYLDLGRHLCVKPDYDYRLINEAAASVNGSAQDVDVDAALEAVIDDINNRTGPFAYGFFDPFKPE